MSKAKLDGKFRVSQYIESLGLKSERCFKAERRAGQTPDFKVYGGDTLAFYCELKTAREDNWMDDLWRMRSRAL